jgi:hypothetical protein
MTDSIGKMTWWHKKTPRFQEWLFGRGDPPFNSKNWAICIGDYEDRPGYEVTYYRAYYVGGVFHGFLEDNWDEHIEYWPHGIEELKAYAIAMWRMT